MAQNVEITFACIPLRSVGRFDPPLDATEEQRALWVQLHRALNTHGAHNAFFLYNATCVFHFTHHPTLGMVDANRAVGEVAADISRQALDADVDDADRRAAAAAILNRFSRKAIGSDLSVELQSETCPWLTAEAVAWLKETVEQAVRIEFDRYIAAGDLQRTIDRLRDLEAETEAKGGYLGMGL